MHARGFSLAEAIVVIAVSGMLISVMLGVVISANSVIRIESAREEILTANRNALTRMVHEFQDATSVRNSQTINGTLYTTSRTVAVLSLPSLDANHAPVAGSYDYVAFLRDPSDQTKLIRVMETAPGSFRSSGISVLALFVSNLRFEYNEPDPSASRLVETYVETARTVYGKTVAISSTDVATLRNKTE